MHNCLSFNFKNKTKNIYPQISFYFAKIYENVFNLFVNGGTVEVVAKRDGDQEVQRYNLLDPM